MKSIGISPDGGEPNCIGGIDADEGAAPPEGAAGAAAGVAVPPDGEAIGVAAGADDASGAAAGAVDAIGDAAGVAWAITLNPKLPGDPWPDGAATAVSPKLATISEVRTPVVSRFKIAS